MRRVIVLVIASLTLAACGSGDPDALDLRSSIIASCDDLHRCRTAFSNDAFFAVLYGDTVEECRATFTQLADAVVTSIDEGRTRYDADAAARCGGLDTSRRTCEELFANTCDEPVLQGLQPDGSPCVGGWECAGDRCVDSICTTE